MFSEKFKNIKTQTKKLFLIMAFGFMTMLAGSSLYLGTNKVFFCKSIQNMFSPNLIFLIAIFSCLIHLASITFKQLSPLANYYYKHSIDLTFILFGASCGLLTTYYFIEFGLTYNPIVLKAAIVLPLLLIVLCAVTLLPYQIFLNIELNRKNINESVTHLLSFSIIFSIPFAALAYILITNWSLKDMTICKKPDQAECIAISDTTPVNLNRL